MAPLHILPCIVLRGRRVRVRPRAFSAATFRRCWAAAVAAATFAPAYTLALSAHFAWKQHLYSD
eukprot:15464680-Alexandrium_andersonii.AAC.1